MFEILSPAGSMDALKAAIQNGANAVYLGGSFFSARASAANFTNEELIEAVKYASLRDVNIYVTVNTSIKEIEFNELVKYTDFLYKIGVSAIIISDIGVAYYLKNRYPNMEIHASTQLSAHSLRDVIELEKNGFDRVVLARELDIDEIKEICSKANIDIEVFIHGALCVSYSGQCLMSSLLGGRSGNRGRCAQPCRQSYTLINKKDNKVIKTTSGDFLLSPRDLCSIDNIEKILETGAKSLKIEGRMKRPEYVATVTKSYREAVDNYLNKTQINKNDIKNNLKAIFNRKFTDGYLMKQNGSDIMNTDKPHNIGLEIGKVVEYNSKKNRLKIYLTGELSKGDGINIGGGNIGRIIKNDKIYDSAKAGETIEIDFIKNIKSGAIIYKTSDKSLIDKALDSFKNDIQNRKVDLNCKIHIKVGEKIKFTLENIDVFSDEIVEESRSKKADIDNIINKLSKTGNTPFNFIFTKISIDENSFVPVSILNNLRREALKKYEDSLLNFEERKNIIEFKNNYSKIDNIHINLGNLTLKVHKNMQLDDLIASEINFSNNIKEIYSEDFLNFEKYYELLKEKGINLIFSAPGVIRNDEYSQVFNYLKRYNKDIFSKVQISTWGSKSFFEEYFETRDFNIDTYFNIYNSKSIEFFSEIFKSKNITISQEISKEEIYDILKNKYNNVIVDMIVYGHSRSMLTEYCAMGVLTKNCHRNKRTAECARSDYVLKDMENREFRLFQDTFCRTEIRNHAVLDLRNYVDEIFNLGVNRIRLDFTHENKEDVYNIILETIDVINKNKKIKLNENHTLGHYFKSVD